MSRDNREKIKISILLACHNRREMTVRCLESVYRQDTDYPIQRNILLLDDGSTDGTSKAVRDKFPEVKIIQGDGSYFWAGGMRKLMRIAMLQDSDVYLWLNDDVKLYSGVLDKSLDLLCDGKKVLVGSTQDPESGAWTYGGSTQDSFWNPLSFTPVEPKEKPVQVDNFWGNCVVLHSSVVDKVGNISSVCNHAAADHDYALRIREEGIKIWLIPNYVGTCKRDNKANSLWDILSSSTYMPVWDKTMIALRHGNVLSPIVVIGSYIKSIFKFFAEK